MKKTSSPGKLSRPPLNRMMRIHDELKASRFPNCRKLSQELEVSERTIMRDIDFMRDQLGLPIDYDSVKYGYYYTEAVGGFPTVQVSEGELVALFVAQKSLAQYRGTSFEKPLTAAFEKLTSGLDDEVSFELGNWEESFSFRSTGGAPISDLKLFERLSKSVLERREVTFEYSKLTKDGGLSSEIRKVWPYNLTCQESQWYVFAHDLDRNALRTFALPRIKALKETGKSFKKPKDFSVNKELAGSFGVFSGKEKYNLKLEFDAFASQLIRERTWHASQKLKEKKDGTVELSMKLGSLPEVERWILSWSHHVKVLQPKELRESIKERVKLLSEEYL